MNPPPTIHATSIVLGTRGVLIRGRPGAGKTALALHLLDRCRPSVFSCLISDDRTAVASENGRLVARSVASIAGLAEIRGIGIAAARRHADGAVVSLIVDLVAAEELDRLPDPADRTIRLEGICVPLIKLQNAESGSLDANAHAVLAALDLSHACGTPSVDGGNRDL